VIPNLSEPELKKALLLEPGLPRIVKVSTVFTGINIHRLAFFMISHVIERWVNSHLHVKKLKQYLTNK
jgi:hypothetical protein